METNPLLSASRRWLAKRALFFKLLGVGFLALVLMIPLQMVRSTLWERLQRHNRAVESITSPWGQRQQIAGPILVAPFTHKVEQVRKVLRSGQEVFETQEFVSREEAFFLPDSLEVSGAITPLERNRGIYRTHVYTAALQMKGAFSKPDLSALPFEEVTPDWSRARICLVATDMRGVHGALELDWGGEAVRLEPGTGIKELTTGVQGAVTWGSEPGTREFSMKMKLNGSGGLMVVPTARETAVKLASPWQAPSFRGAHLPAQRQVGEEGFSATWNVSYYGRPFGQWWTTANGPGGDLNDLFRQAAFGVDLFEPLNAYRATERAIKYGILFIVLVFSVFFLFEVLADVRLNALNYLLVGAALCLFYLGVLALSEFVSFGAAYAVSAAASVGMIGLYCRRILRERRRAWLVSGLIGGVLAYLYLVLQMEDFALLAGTAGLFTTLAVIMYATRKLDVGNAPETVPPPVPAPDFEGSST